MRFFAAALGLLFALSTAAIASARPRRDRDRNRDNVMVYEFADMDAAGTMSATPGGAQDIRHFRDQVAHGEIPHPNVFTPEGLFSEHHLPLQRKAKCPQLMCVSGEAAPARLLAQPEVRFVGQLGFSTNIDAKTFQRRPLNLVAVVDKSGSMTSALPLVQQSLRTVLDQLGPNDQLSIVLYGDRAHVLMSPTRANASNRRAIRRHIAQIAADGSTAMEDGLRVGFRLARRSQRKFDGTTRVMLFTDERPNVGVTDRHSFMALARAASADGIGMTTVGVDVNFGAELATAISSVRGGNLFFFPDVDSMTETFRDDFDTMVTELAHALRLSIRPAAGMRIAGVYGIPGDKLRWAKDGSLQVEIETLFLSRRAGAIYVATAPVTRGSLPAPAHRLGAAIAHVELDFTPVGKARRKSATTLTTVAPERRSLGLTRGLLLVDQITVLKEAARKHHVANDQEGAYQLVHALAGRFRRLTDEALVPERDVVLELERILARRSGHAGEPTPNGATRDAVTGLPAPHVPQR